MATIVDVHTHAFVGQRALNDPFLAEASLAHGGTVDLQTSPEHYLATSPAGTRAIVVGGKARAAGLWVDDEAVAAYAATNPDRFWGYLSLDPSQPGWRDELLAGHRRLGLRGIKLMPMYAGFDPADPAFDPLYRYASDQGLPLLVHTGTTFVSTADLRWARPVHLDRVAIRFPELRMVLAHLGHPYESECIAVVRKHRHVFADLSALHYRPFQLWHALNLVQEYGVWDKVLFGSDYPFTTVHETLDGLRRIAAIEHHGFAPLSLASVEDLIYRPSGVLLGLE